MHQMHPYTISNNVIIISRPNEIIGLNEIIRDVTSNNRRSGGNNVRQIPLINQSIDENNIEYEYDGDERGNLVYNNRANLSNDLLLNRRRFDNRVGRYRKSMLIDSLPQRDLYVLKTNVEPMIYFLFDKLSILNNLKVFIVNISWEIDQLWYYVLVKFTVPKKISSNYLIYFEPVNLNFTLETAYAYINNIGDAYFIPEQTINHKKINEGYTMKDQERKKKEAEKNSISINNEFGLGFEWGKYEDDKRKESGGDKCFFWNENSSTRAGSPNKDIFGKGKFHNSKREREDRRKECRSGKIKGKGLHSKEKLKSNERRSRDWEGKRIEDSDIDEVNEEIGKKESSNFQLGDGIGLNEEGKKENSIQKLNISRIDTKKYGGKGKYFK